MAQQHTIFDRLRTMQPRRGEPLSALIARACDVGDQMIVALATIASDSRDVVQRGTASRRTAKAYSIANRALDLAYESNGNGDNGSKRSAA
jgi:hypothetical protein